MISWNDVTCASDGGVSQCAFHKKFYNNPESNYLKNLVIKKKKIYAIDEENIRSLFSTGAEFIYKGAPHVSLGSYKPRASSFGGEPKNDVFVYAQNMETNHVEHIKISFKKSNSDFLENKMDAQQAESILGENFKEILTEAFTTMKLSHNKFYNDSQDSYVLGYRVDIMSKAGNRYVKVELPHDRLMKIYSGVGSPQQRIDCKVNGWVVKNSGVADYILMGDTYTTTQQAIDNLETIESYVKRHNTVYVAFKALSFLTHKIDSERTEWDGDRPLAFTVDWTRDSETQELNGIINTSMVYTTKGNDAGKQFKKLYMK